MSTRDITFNVQKTLDTGIHAVGKKKHYIQDMMTNGLHFRFRNMTNEEIVAEIDAYLDSIERELNIPFCLYRDTYNNININVNIKMYIFDHLRMYIFAILPLDRYIFSIDRIFP